jgi:uncharacterized protein (DUF433 family)
MALCKTLLLPGQSCGRTEQLKNSSIHARQRRVRPPYDKLKLGVPMGREFIERREGSFYLIGSRVPLAHLVLEFQQGELPEAIRSHYPTLNLEQVYGAITFCLGAKQEVEKDIAERGRVEDEFTRSHPAPPRLKEKLDRARQQLLARRT